MAATVRYGRARGPLGTTKPSAMAVDAAGPAVSGTTGATGGTSAAGGTGEKSERFGAERLLIGVRRVRATSPGFLVWMASPSLDHRLAYTDSSRHWATSVW